MEDERKTKKELIEELNELRQSVAELKGCAEEIKQTRANQEKFTKAFLQNSIPVAITTIKDGRYVDVSDTFCKFMESQRDEIIGHTAVEMGFITAEQRQSYIYKLNKSGRIENFEVKLRTKNGSLRHGLFNAIMMTLGNEKYLLSVMTDISDRKQMEDVLRESEERYRQLFENTRDLIYITDAKGFLTFINPPFEKILGFAYDEWKGQPFTQIVAPEYIDLTKDIFKKSMKGEFVPVYEVDLISKDGTNLSVEFNVTTLYDSEGKPAGRHGIGRDITERKRAQEETHRVNVLLNAIIENIPNTIFLKDAQELRFILFNRAGEELTGYSRNDLQGKNDYDFVPKEQADFFTEKDREVLRGQAVLDIPEEPLQTRNKEKRILHTKKVPIMKENGEPEYLLGISEDITDRKHAEEELEKYREHLEEMVKERTAELESKNISLQGLTTTLKVLLKQREDDKKDMEERFVMNVRNLVLPYVKQMKKGSLDVTQRSYLDVIETHLQDIATPLMKNLRQFNLTPKEIKVAMLVRQGKPTKEIAEILSLATSSIDSHRKSIRNKLGLISKKLNLQAHLEILEH